MNRQEITAKLECFRNNKKIPNIIFHGENGSGKRTIVYSFINSIYNNDIRLIQSYVMFVNCSHSKGIKFIREDLKFFAKTNINYKAGSIFKSIVLLNADKLTIEAQSALRRCIEMFSHNTRFFIVVEDINKLLRPIISRFCEIFVANFDINLYQVTINETFAECADFFDDRKQHLVVTLNDLSKMSELTKDTIMDACEQLYELAYSAIDIISLLESGTIPATCEQILLFNKVRKEFRNEKLLMTFILTILFVSSDESLENISYM